MSDDEWEVLREQVRKWVVETPVVAVDGVMAVFLEYLEHAEVLGPVGHDWPDV